MSDPTPAPEGGAPDVVEGESPEAPRGRPDPTQALLRKLRKAEKEIESLRSVEQQRKESELTEAERWKKKAEQAEELLKSSADKMRQQTLKHRFEALASKAGALDVEDAFRLADLSSVEVDEDGNVTGLDDVIATLRKTKKYLFGQSTPAAPGGNPPTGSPGQITPERLRQMTPAEFAQLNNDLMAGRIKL